VAFPANIDLSSLNGPTGFYVYGAAGDLSGYSVGSAGDVDGDGFADLIISAPGASPHGLHSGVTYVVLGRAEGFGASFNLASVNGSEGSNPGFKLSGVSAYDFSGLSVASAGDINGDGFDDLIVGAPYSDPHGTDSGTSYVVFGKASGFAANIDLSTLNGSAGFKLSGEGAISRSGWSVASAGDINQDGFDDLIIGSPGANANGTYSGASYVVFGRASAFAANIDLSTLNGSTGFKLSGVAAGDQAGMSVSSAGDVNGDGYDDLLIGAVLADPHGTDSGASYVVFGKASSFAANINLSTLNGANGFKLSGVAAGDRTGWATAAAGDVNGDGYDDLIIGAAYADPNGSRSGATYVVFGKASGFAANLDLSTLNGSTGFKLSGATSGDLSGYSVSSAGDFNGDGFDDVIVGARGADPHGSASGASYIVFGKATGFSANLNLSALDGRNGLKLSGVSENSWSGEVSAAGDLNGDGFDDVIVGAWMSGTNGDIPGPGASYVVYGRAEVVPTLAILDGSNGFKLGGVAAADYSGVSVASAGDINGDGFDDVIVGAWRVDAGAADSGASYVVFGKASGFAANINLSALNGSTGFKLGGAMANDRAGTSVASAGDVNGDGFADLIVSAPYADPHGTNSGVSYVVFGKASGFAADVSLSTLNGTSGFKLSGVAAEDFSGISVGSAGDFNGDGFDDLIVGAWGVISGGAATGAAYIVYGKASGFAANINLSNLNGNDGIRLLGAADGDQTGAVVASAGDVNGDGYDDVIVGARKSGPNGEWSGMSYVVFGGASGVVSNLDLSTLNGSNGFKLSGVSALSQSGFSVASAGDVNGDGFADLVIGAPYANPHGAKSGESYVVFGKASGFAADIDLSTLNGSNGFKLQGSVQQDFSGFSVASAGDFNGDGFADIVIGAPGSDLNGAQTGTTYVMFGKASGFAASIDLSTLNGANGFMIAGTGIGDQSGTSAASAGDVNGDGYDDLIIGAERANANGAASGATYVLFGGNFGGSMAPVATSGTAAAEILIGGRNNDWLWGAGGGDVFHGGAGNDRLLVDDLAFRLADGGGGTDTLELRSAGLTLDLTDPLVAAKLESIERIDLTGTGNNTLVIDQAAVLGGLGAVSGGKHTLVVTGEFGDKVQFAESGWAFAESVMEGDVTFDRWVLGDAEVLVRSGLAGTPPFGPVVDLTFLDGANGFKLSGEGEQGKTGWSVASAGDINGDGFDDLIIGSWYAYEGVNTSYVVFGKASGFAANIELGTLNGTNGFQVMGSTQHSGLSVASAGDVNGDGFDDLVLGDPDGFGRNIVVFGKASGFAASLDPMSLDGSNGFTITGASFHDLAGYSVASAGDVNGDGFDDLIIGTAAQFGALIDTSGMGVSTAYVVFGKASGFDAELNLSALNGSNGFKFIPVLRSNDTGFSVASAGDVNGDGYADLIVGAPSADTNANNAGATYVVFGKASGFDASFALSSLNGSNGFRLSGVGVIEESGHSVASAGDVNGDGFDDIVIGAPNADLYAGAAGAAYVVFGKASGFAANLNLSTLNGSNGFKLLGEPEASRTGWSVASAGDFNGDGFDDVIVGAPGSYNASYVVFGKASGFAASIDLGLLDGSNGFKLTNNDYSGWSVASAGDVNGDGYDDLIIGSPEEYSLGVGYPGRSYVVFGGAFGHSLAPVTTTGTAAAEILIGGRGADILTGKGGGDVFHAGAGNDRLVVADLTFRLADGGGGTDTLALSGAGLMLDLSNLLVAARLESIERIDLTGSGNNTLIVSLPGVLGGVGSVAGGKHILVVEGNAGDKVQFLESAWNKIETFTNVDGTFDRWVLGDAEVHVEQIASPTGMFIAGTAGNDVISTTTTVPGQPLATIFADTIEGGAGDDVLDGGGGNDLLYGGADNDVLIGAAGGDILYGQGGDDILIGGAASAGGTNQLWGGSGSDTASYAGTTGPVHAELSAQVAYVDGVLVDQMNSIENLIGGSGDDMLVGDAGANVLAGRAGNDTYVIGSGDTVVEAAGEGTDTVQSSISYTLTANVENLVLTGSATINGTGNALANGLTGNDGINVLDGGAGADTMAGGLGNDSYVVDDAGDVVIEAADEGSDTVRASVSYTLGANVEKLTLQGTAYLNGTGNALVNTLTGNAGNNLLDGGLGADTMIGGLGNDTYVVDDIGDVLSEALDGGLDAVQSSVSYRLRANIENLTLTGGANIDGTGNELANALLGNAGNNMLDGGLGADTMTGGLGDDTYVMDVSTDKITELAGQGVDTVQTTFTHVLRTNFENLTLLGAAAISAVGNTVDNVLTGNVAANVLDGGAGADTMAGGRGNDTYVVENAGDLVIEQAGEGTDAVRAWIDYTLTANVEKLTLQGTANLNGTGNDLANTLVGNAGNNILDGGLGGDTMTGGAGDDTYVIDNAADRASENAGGGFDTLLSSITYMLRANAEKLVLTGADNINAVGNTQDNILTGTAGNNILDGGAGADEMTGGDGNDTYVVENAGDVVIEAADGGTDAVRSWIDYTLGANVEKLSLYGTANINGTGNELANGLLGNTGRNVLDGGLGADVLTGNGGGDTFRFSTALGADNVDRITAFDHAADTIQLDDAIFAALGTGALDAGAFNTGSVATQADDRILYDTASKSLYYDADGAGGLAAVRFATIATLTGTLDHTDFFVV